MDEHDLENIISFEVLVKIQMKDIAEPIMAPTVLSIPKGSPLKTPRDVAEFCMESLLIDLDAKSTEWLILGDSLGDRRCFYAQDIKYFQVFAPESLPEELLEDGEV